MNDVLLWVIAVLLYLLCGLLFGIAYIWNFKTEEGAARLGLMGLFWPLILLIDLVVDVASQFGQVAKKLSAKRLK